MKRILPSLLASVLLLSTTALAAEPALPRVRSCTGFSDVPETAWYADAVKLCYEAGVLNGTSATAFSPQSSLTTAQLEVLTARAAWRLRGNEGDSPPAAPAGTGRVSVSMSDGTVYDAAGFIDVADSGLKDKELPHGTYIVTIAGKPIHDKSYPHLTLTVDADTVIRANLDKRNSWDPMFYMFRYHISDQAYAAHDPLVRVNTYAETKGASVDAWYWGADLYLRGLEGAMDAELPDSLARNATRYDAAAVMSLIAPDAMLAPLHRDVPPDTDRADVLRLYQAGVITGVDADGNFNGEGTLTRAQFAVLLARLLQSDLRPAPQGT